MPPSHPLRVLALPKDRFRDAQPYHARLADALAAVGVEVDEFSVMRGLAGRYGIVHLHHPEKFVAQRLTLRDAVRFAAFFAVLWTQRLKGARIVWTAHNDGPHEPGHPGLEWLYWRLLLPALHGVHFLSEASRLRIVAERAGVARLPTAVIPHGELRDCYPDRLDRAQARARLGYAPEHRVLAFVGNVRGYKNVPALARCVAALPDPELRLVIAGKVHTAALKAEIAAVADPRIALVDRFLGAADFQLYLRAADLVVLPFRRILNSGSAILALSFDRPVLVPDMGSLRELRDQVGSDWVHLYDGDLTPAIVSATLRTVADRPLPARAPLDSLGWPRIGQLTVDAYMTVLGQKSQS